VRVPGKDQIAVFGKEYLGAMGQGNGWVWNVGGVRYHQGVGTVVSLDGETRTPLFDGISGVVNGGKH
jgi:hypothetical protein